MVISSLAGQRAVVTGATSGIGRAVGLALAARGVGTILLGRDEDRLCDVVAAAGAGARGLAVDLTSENAPDRVAEALLGAPGLDILVHAAGAFSTGELIDTPGAELDRLWRTNVLAPWEVTRRLLPALVAGGGQVVFVGSSIAFGARGGLGGYAATKAALKAMADALRDEVNPRGVRVLSVYPGRTATPMQERIFAAEARPWNPASLLQPEDVAATILAALELPPTAELTELSVRPMRKP